MTQDFFSPAIPHAAELIAHFDRALARHFLCRPIGRHGIVTAMYPGVERAVGREMAEDWAVTIRSAIDADFAARVGEDE